MNSVETLIGVGELGCTAAMPLPPGPGSAPMSTDAGVEWVPAVGGGPTVVDVAVVAGGLAVTVNGVTATVAGVLLADAFGVDLGYLLPVG